MTDALDLGGLPERDRFDAWRALADPIFDVRLPQDSAGPFQGEVTSFALGDALLICSAVSGQHYERGTGRTRSGEWDQVAFQLYETGGFVGDYDGREVRVGPGDLNAIDFTRPYRKLSTDETDINLIVPRAVAARLYPGFEHGTVRSQSLPCGALAATQLAAVARIGRGLSAAEATAAVEAMLTLLAQSELRAASPAARASLRASVRHRAARFIRTHLLDADLDPDRACRACRVSRASLFRAFAADGGVLSFIRTERLHLAARHLRDRPDTPIGEVAEACGFLEPSQFARQFRKLFGRSPSESRQQKPGSGVGPLASGPLSWLDTFRALRDAEPD